MFIMLSHWNIRMQRFKTKLWHPHALTMQFRYPHADITKKICHKLKLTGEIHSIFISPNISEHIRKRWFKWQQKFLPCILCHICWIVIQLCFISNPSLCLFASKVRQWSPLTQRRVHGAMNGMKYFILVWALVMFINTLEIGQIYIQRLIGQGGSTAWFFSSHFNSWYQHCHCI